MDIKNSLHPWDKPHFIMLYDPFNVLLDCFASILLRIFMSMFISEIGLYFFFIISLSNFGIRVMVTLQSKFESVPSSTMFWNGLLRIGLTLV